MTPSPPPSSLSGRLARRAIDLLVIGFFGVVALSVGSQLIEWWRTDPESITPDLTGLAGVDLDWSRTPIAMQFGDASTSIERTPLQGDSDRLDEVLTKAAQSIVGSSQLPTAPPTHAEREWLTALETAPPVLWDSTLGNVYRRDEPLPSFVATRLVDAADRLAGEPIQRVVGWGLAFPTARGQWTIYTFRPEATRAMKTSATRDIPLPEKSRRVTQLRGADGCQWLVFQGRDDLARWVQHFDDAFGAKAVLTRTVGTQSASLKYRLSDTIADVQLRRERDGSLTGVVWSTTTNAK